MWFVVCGLWFVVSGEWCAVCGFEWPCERPTGWDGAHLQHIVRVKNGAKPHWHVALHEHWHEGSVIDGSSAGRVGNKHHVDDVVGRGGGVAVEGGLEEG